MRRITPDAQKAEALKKMAKQTLARIADTDAKKYPSPVLKDYYDVLHYLMESLACLKGVKTDGEGAHAELIDWTCREFRLPESDRQFLHILRNNRNRIAYEGSSIGYEFLADNEAHIAGIAKSSKIMPPCDSGLRFKVCESSPFQQQTELQHHRILPVNKI